MSRIRGMVPLEVRRALRYMVGLAGDATDRIRGRRDDLPPRRLRYVGAGEFSAVGKELARELADIGGLRPTDDVLDVGCGVGRVALPLTEYLGPDGSYFGFDVVPAAIEWCRTNITPRFPTFRFEHVDLQNTMYRKRQGADPATFQFPAANDSFDFAFATSVFTHLLPDTMSNYVREIARVLRPGGTSFTTWFILDDDTRQRIAGRQGTLSFHHDHGDYAIDDRRVPEASVAYDEHAMRETFERNGMSIVEPIDFSNWSGRAGARPGQDIVIARR